MARKIRTPEEKEAARQKRVAKAAAVTPQEKEAADKKRWARAAAKAGAVLRSGAFYDWDSANDTPTAEEMEQRALIPKSPLKSGFNSKCVLPYGLTVGAIEAAMHSFCDFLKHINASMLNRQLPRFESVIMQANFSSIVGEFCKAGIPKECTSLVANKHHNGHPDLLPKGRFVNDSIKHAGEGIEIKGSRRTSGWQGHNEEACWLMVFVFASSRPPDVSEGMPPVPFAFVGVSGAQLEVADWSFSERGVGSKRTITASVLQSGYQKMTANWIYRDPSLFAIVEDEAVGPAEGASEQELT